MVTYQNFCNIFPLKLSRNANKMQRYNRIYYSKVYWRLNMFRAAYRSSSGALNSICSLWFIYTCGDQPLSRLSGIFPPSLDNGRSPHVYINQRLQIEFRAPDDERYAARGNKLWKNKFYYKVAPCWLFLLIYTTMHESMNIKKNSISFFLHFEPEM